MVHVSQIMWNNLYSAVCQVDLNKMRRNKKQELNLKRCQEEGKFKKYNYRVEHFEIFK